MQSLSWLVVCVAACVVLPLASASKSGKGAGAGRGFGDGTEEIIIPLGGDINLGGMGGGGMTMPLNQLLEPGIQMPQGQSMGFEETEEIGPDGKPHIISEHAFNPAGGHLTAAQKTQEKSMRKEMKDMAQDMSHMFQNGGFGGGGGKSAKQNMKWEDDLFKNAIKTIQAQSQIVPQRVGGGSQQQLSRNQPQWGPSGVDPNRRAQKIPNGWQITGNSDILNQAGIIVASCLLLGAAFFFGHRFWKTKIQYRPVNEDGIEVL